MSKKKKNNNNIKEFINPQYQKKTISVKKIAIMKSIYSNVLKKTKVEKKL